MKHSFYQTHECCGFRAKVTVEWETPDDKTYRQNMANAEAIADEVFCKIGTRARDIVQAMRGRS